MCGANGGNISFLAGGSALLRLFGVQSSVALLYTNDTLLVVLLFSNAQVVWKGRALSCKVLSLGCTT
jgi:hypothetical protein